MGASTSIVLVFAIIADIYEGLQAMRLISFINGSLTSLMAIAPIIGGFVNEFVGWRGNYMIVAFISLISWSLQFFFLQETRKTLELFNANNIIYFFRN
nr:MFS transporter [Orientia tsutsugamushi]